MHTLACWICSILISDEIIHYLARIYILFRIGCTTDPVWYYLLWMPFSVEKCKVGRTLELKGLFCKGFTVTSPLVTTAVLATVLYVSPRRILNEQRKCQNKVWVRFDCWLYSHSRCEKYYLLFINKQYTVLNSIKFEHIAIKTFIHYKQTSLERKD